MIGSIEAGGTKFVCAVGNDNLDIIDQVSFPTTNPHQTMGAVIDFFKKYDKYLEAIGVGSFGPIDINKESSTYGYITATPKTDWQNFDFIGMLEQAFPIPIYWTTDVNAACYGEYIAGSGKGLSNVVYYTIGTGIGGGAIMNGSFIEGFSHPEMGHMLVQKHSEDTYEGNCIFHTNCLEGLAAGPAIEKRTGTKAQFLNEDNSFWNIEADYIAQCVYNTTLLLSPEVIILGGGVMNQAHLLPKIREKFSKYMNEYVNIPDITQYIVTPKLEGNSGVIGGLALAKTIIIPTK